ncbi:OmpA family protein [Polaribacter porphyrae]|uniref:Cell envelope biogenesis protein OmpA n=1 Tax=Polaribacter porphyrae TaxID=1137780 RepID=A0A2S7WJV1_9FLAO|nr:OmpA family protein [Polaribacter porphyrae]PQJ77885.1 cell envelope biogenesis protein OmpA [Polaribacter porphyrae]
MKKQLLNLTFLLLAVSSFSQVLPLPQNPEPGKCYVMCKTPEIWKNEEVKIEVSPSYKKIITHPAEYKTVTEKVIVKQATTKLEIVPAVWETKTIEYEAKEDANKLTAVAATFTNDSERIETKASSASWQMSGKKPGCESSDPNDCRYWCYKPIPATYLNVPLKKLKNNATTEIKRINGYKKSYTRKVILNPETTKEVNIPAVYGTIKKIVLVKDAWKEEVTIPAKFKTIKKEVLVTKGGLTTWKEVECELVENTPLPINWKLNSATLTLEAKRLIDTRLLPILKTGVAVAIESHTDSRGKKDSNQNLSDRRAKSVINYLISKGINTSQLIGNGYGESRLINRCSDGVSCSEAEHAQNRRTTFRVINQQ